MSGQEKQADVHDEPDADGNGVARGFFELLDPGDYGGRLLFAHFTLVVHGNAPDQSDGRCFLADKVFRDRLWRRSQVWRFGNHILMGWGNERDQTVSLRLADAGLLDDRP